MRWFFRFDEGRSRPFRSLGLAALALALWFGSSTGGVAQIKPMSSGQPSFNAPEMRRHRSGLYRPNRPHRHRRRHRRVPFFLPR